MMTFSFNLWEMIVNSKPENCRKNFLIITDDNSIGN